MKTKVLFVCLGNICRSPAAEAILRHFAEREGLQDKIHIESCGLGDWHVGELPDPRMRSAAKTRGFIMASRAQKFQRHFFEEFDYILAADHEILENLHRFTDNPEHKSKMHLFTAFGSAYQGKVIPDPYYRGDLAFENILDMLEDACEGLILEIKGQDR